MALRSVVDHPKFADLKTALSLSKFEALGMLEALWHFTGKYALQGDIGKFTDKQIEAWIEWRGAPGAAVAALTDARWLDASPEHRILVHDWHEHADATTKKQLGRMKKKFVTDMSGQHKDMSGQNGKVDGPPAPGTAPGTGVGTEPAQSDDLDVLVPAIVCAHPASQEKGLQPHQVTHAQRTAVLDVLAGDRIDAPSLLALTQAIARIVLAEWPPGKSKFCPGVDKFFREREFQKPLEAWRGQYADNSGNKRTSDAFEALRRADAADRGDAAPPEHAEAPDILRADARGGDGRRKAAVVLDGTL